MYSHKSALLLDMNSTFMFGEDNFGTQEDFSAYYHHIGGCLASHEINQIIRLVYVYLDERYPDVQYRHHFPSVATAIKAVTSKHLSDTEIANIVATFAFYECLEICMSYYIIKIVITTCLIVGISEIAKRSSLIGALLASIPLVSVLAMFWLYVDTKDVAKVSALATSVFWLVLPSLALFIALPLLLKQGLNFYLSMVLAMAITAGSYALMLILLQHFNIKL